MIETTAGNDKNEDNLRVLTHMTRRSSNDQNIEGADLILFK
jgi:hypothetical protein